MILVVSDTSPIRALDHLGLLHVLGLLFQRVIVPPAVVAELSQPKPRFTPVDVTSISFFEVCLPTDKTLIQHLRTSLDSGESEAIALAIEVNAEAVLIDEAAGRDIAAERGLTSLGTLGILVRAKQQGFLKEVRPLIEKLIDELDFFVSEKLRRCFEIAKLKSNRYGSAPLGPTIGRSRSDENGVQVSQ